MSRITTPLRRSLFVKLLVVVGTVVLLQACGGGGKGGGGGSVLPNNVPRFAYVTSSVNSSITIYTVNAATGQLRHNGYAATGSGPESVTIDPSGKFAYVANYNSHDISVYTINASTGALTQVNCGGAAGCNGANFVAGTNPTSVTVDPLGKFAYVANSNADSVSAYTINTTT